MAGFDFAFDFPFDAKILVEACLKASARRAKQLDIKWYRRRLRSAPNRFYVNVDGNTRRLDLLGERLERDLPLVAEGVSSPANSTRRRQLGLGVADLYLRGRDISEPTLSKLVPVERTKYWYPFIDDIDSPTISPNVRARLIVTNTVIVGWHMGELPAEVVLEELHAACELVLDDIFNKRSRRLSFSELTQLAVDSEAFHSLPHLDLARSSDLLGELKDLRKDVRHRATSGAEEWVESNSDAVLAVLESLARYATNSLTCP